MGKIGDLWVKISAKTDDYKKGIEGAKKDTKGFGSALKSMKAGALAVWAAIGTAAIAMGKEIISGTNRIGDAFAHTTSGMKSAWNTFIGALSTWDWEGFGQRIRDSFKAGKELAQVSDAEFEVLNSIQIQRGKIGEQLAQWQIDMRDQTKSYEERKKAAQNYLQAVKPLYDAEIKLRESMLDATLGNWITGNSKDFKNTVENRKALISFFEQYGTNAALQTAIQDYIAGTKDVGADAAAYDRALAWAGADYERRSWLEIGKMYENKKGDKTNQPIVDAINNFYNAQNAYLEENRRIFSVLNAATAMGGEEEIEKVHDFGRMIEEISTPDFMPSLKLDVDTSDLIPAEKNIQHFRDVFAEDVAEIQALNAMLEDAVIGGVSGGVQAIMDNLMGLEGADPSQILGALMEPFAQMAIRLGEMLIAEGLAIGAFKESLKSLNPAVAIAAGVALIGVGAALKAGIQSLAQSRGAGGASMSYGGGGYSSPGTQDISSELTIHVVGKISGSDIIISGENQRKKWLK